MNPLSRLSRGLERRSAPGEVWPRGLSFTSFPVLRSTSSSGQVVTVQTSLETIPVYAAVSIIAGAIGSLPLKVYREEGDTRVEAKTSRQWKLLHDLPNPETAADEFWELVMASLLLWGNAFIWKERGPLDTVEQLWVLDPARVRVSRESAGRGQPSMRVFWIDGVENRATEQDILHVRGMGSDGLVGYSPIQLAARNRLGTDMAREEFAGSFWRNGTFAGAVLEHPNKLSEGAIERLKTQIREKSGTLRAGEALILEEDMKWKELGMPLQDAQFVEQANLSRLEIATLYQVPPHKLGASFENRSLTYSNAEWEGLDFVKWTLRHWLVRVESSLARDPAIFPAPGRKLYPEFLVDALLRADTRSRYDAYKVGLDGGWLSVKWIHETENLNIPEEDLKKPEPPVIALPAAVGENGKEPAPVPAKSPMGFA